MRVSWELLVLCTWEVLLSQVGKAVRTLTGASARKLCPIEFRSFLAGGKCRTVSISSIVSFAEKLFLWQQCGREGHPHVYSMVGRHI